MPELKACNCCDGTNFDAFTELEPPLNGIVRCRGCNLQMRRSTLPEAITAWNKSVLRGVCAEAYQLAGAAGAPVKALDNLSAASQGAPLPHKTFLPITDIELTGLRPNDAVIAQAVKELETLAPIVGVFDELGACHISRIAAELAGMLPPKGDPNE